MSQLLINNKATQDLSNIVKFLSQYSFQSGEQFINAFERKCQNLAQFPEMGRSYSELRADLRGISFSNYIIFYKMLEDRGVEILRVVHGQRDLSRLFLDFEDEQNL